MDRGQITTPPAIVTLMIAKLFGQRNPQRNDTLLDPGCGSGTFILGVLNWCRDHNVEIPNIVGVESDLFFVEEARKLIGDREQVRIINKDFLSEDYGTFDFIICNPPYVRLEGLSDSKRDSYRKKFTTAVNRFDLYVLFFEKALQSLKPSGRLVFITPEKYEYTLTTKPLRKLMTKYDVEEIHHISEDAFKGLVTYPAITIINNQQGEGTKVIHRDNSSVNIKLPTDGSRWISVIRGDSSIPRSGAVLEDICVRISCGVATGKDEIFVMNPSKVPQALKVYAYPAVSGKNLTPEGIQITDNIIVPYNKAGILPKEDIKQFKDWFSEYKDALSKRFCVTKGKREWYEFHEKPPMADILKPKILCKDIAKEPGFWPDIQGALFPRHSVYYIVPKDPKILSKLLNYLNSEGVRRWLIANCQRAANDFIRLQSSVLKQIPIPKYLVVRNYASQ